MNDESPFRISSMLLTVACLVCGVCAGVLLVPRYMQRAKSVDHSAAVGELQLNLAEFHANEPNSASEKDQPLLPRRRSLVPVSSAIPLKNNAASTVAATTQIGSHYIGGVRSEQAASNLIESTVVERPADQWTSLGVPVSQFSAPVIVHPVTVNIDNSGIFGEISRVHERLDSLAAEKSRFEKEVMTRIEDRNSASPKTAPSGTAVEVHCPAPRQNVVSQDKVHSNVEAASTSTAVSAQVHAELAVTGVSLPAEKSHSGRPQRTIERLKIAGPPVDIIHESLPAPRLEPFPAQASVLEPVADVLVQFHPEASVTPMPEIEFKADPRTPAPNTPSSELPPTDSETTEPQIMPEFEFSTEMLSVPSPVLVTAEVATAIEFEAESVWVTEPVAAVGSPAPFEPEFETAIATNEEKSMPTQTAEFPFLPDLAAPGGQGAKRTTDPPFMNGIITQRSTLPAAITNKAPLKIRRVSPAAEAVKQPKTPSNPNCHDCAKAKEKSSSKIKAGAPPSPIQRLRAFFK